MLVLSVLEGGTTGDKEGMPITTMGGMAQGWFATCLPSWGRCVPGLAAHLTEMVSL